MNVFISWSGERSRCLAEALRNWLKQVINALDPWMSVADIDKGTRWRDHVAARLKTSDIGIICLTPGNLRSEWLLFEAGALSKAIDTSFVCTLLIDLEPSDISGPLAQFQATRASRDEIRRLVRTINSALGASARSDHELDEAFHVWWPKLEDQLKCLPVENNSPRPQRPDRELLEDILAIVRDQSRSPVPMPRPEDQSEGTPSPDALETKLRKVLEALPGEKKSYADEDTPDMARFRKELVNELRRRKLYFSAHAAEYCRIMVEENRLVFCASNLHLLFLKDPPFKPVALRVYAALFDLSPDLVVQQTTIAGAL